MYILLLARSSDPIVFQLLSRILRAWQLALPMKPGNLQNKPLRSACVLRTPLVLCTGHQVNIQNHI